MRRRPPEQELGSHIRRSTLCVNLELNGKHDNVAALERAKYQRKPGLFWANLGQAAGRGSDASQLVQLEV